MTQRRLHDEAPFRRAGEVAELGHGDDVFQLLEVHTAIVNRYQSHDNSALESSLSVPQAGGHGNSTADERAVARGQPLLGRPIQIAICCRPTTA